MKIVLILLILFITLGVFACGEVKENNKHTDIKNIENSSKKGMILYENEGELQRENEYQEEVVYSDEKRDMLFEMKEEALRGTVIGCEFRAKYDNLVSVLEKWGEADEDNYIEEAKGQYFVYKNYNLVFGVNKGLQIFEVRTYDKNISILSFNDIIKFYGEPDYKVITDLDEIIIGYIINSDFKILLVFNDSSKNEKAILDHYSVFYSMGTANLMAEDGSPRQW